MGFIDAGAQARPDRCIGCCEPNANSHATLDRDAAVQEEAHNVARAVAKAVVELRAGRLQAVQPVLSRPRPKPARFGAVRAASIHALRLSGSPGSKAARET